MPSACLNHKNIAILEHIISTERFRAFINVVVGMVVSKIKRDLYADQLDKNQKVIRVVLENVHHHSI